MSWIDQLRAQISGMFPPAPAQAQAPVQPQSTVCQCQPTPNDGSGHWRASWNDDVDRAMRARQASLVRTPTPAGQPLVTPDQISADMLATRAAQQAQYDANFQAMLNARAQVAARVLADRAALNQQLGRSP